MINKSDVINAIASGANMNKTAAAQVWEIIEDFIVSSVVAGEDVSITGFGKFVRRNLAARSIKNLRTGEKIFVPASVAPAFRAGKNFKDRVSGAYVAQKVEEEAVL